MKSQEPTVKRGNLKKIIDSSTTDETPLRRESKKNSFKSDLKKPGHKTRGSVSFSTGTTQVVFEDISPVQRLRSPVQRALKPIREALANFLIGSETRKYSDILRKRYSYSYSLVGHYKSNKLGFWFLCSSIGLLALSSALFFVAFFTNSWGIVESSKTILVGDSEKNVTWNLGLWLCCRNDGRCLGLKWPRFYTMVRLFSVFSLFGHIFTLAWLIGHTIEKLLKYDPCIMISLITLAFLACVSSLVAVLVFEFHWEKHFSASFPNITRVKKSYSFYMAATTIPLTFCSSIALIVDLQSEWRLNEIRKNFGTD